MQAGQIKLFLTTKPDLELKAWVTKDAEGIETRIEVSDLAKGVEFDAEMFKITPRALGRVMDAATLYMMRDAAQRGAEHLDPEVPDLGGL